VNKVRREQISDIIKRLRDIESAATEQLNDIYAEIETVMGEEEEYRDNMPENLQGSDRYSKADEACNYLDEALQDITTAINELESGINSAVDGMESAAE
jgi:prefoldin subunit 5